MKMELYYVVCKFQDDSIGRSGDCQFLDGPFGIYAAALIRKQVISQSYYKEVEIVSQFVEVSP